MSMVFVGGNLALDFVGTLAERGGVRAEHLTNAATLAEWVVRSGVLDTAPKLDSDDLNSAIALRESAYAVIAALIDGRPVPQRQLARVNAAAAVAPPAPRVDSRGRIHRDGDVDAAMSAIARDALALFERSDDAVLKWCADDSCTHPFLDRSRGHRRRWCDMGGCGDRAKVAAYRARKRDAG
jgi:predicted RNA-binding Zn ribbon-like protein